MRKKFQELEALRGGASLYVLCHHISSNYLGLKNTLIGLPLRFGHEAVLIFFVLSGFVIHHSSFDQIASGFKKYFIKRFRRIYPIFILSMLLSLLIVYVSGYQCGKAGDILTSMAGNLLMLQDLGKDSWVSPFLGNYPLWSLSFEWWYYMIYFPIIKFIPEGRQISFVVFLSFLGGIAKICFRNPFSDFLSLLPIWWFGVELAKDYAQTGSISLFKRHRELLLLGVPLCYYSILSSIALARNMSFEALKYPFVELRSFFSVLLLYVISFIVFKNKIIIRGGWLKSLSFIGGISYALYVFHYPLICNLTLFRNGEYFWGDLVLRVFLVFALSYFAEEILQKILVHCTKKCA
jgi:hypothetical protein